MAHQSFAQKVREALLEEAKTGGGEVTASRLSCLLLLPTARDHKRLLNTLSELATSGRIVRIRQGVYAPAADSRTPDKREVMWRLLRMRRTVLVSDLMEMAGVTESYAVEWLHMLNKRNIVVCCGRPTLTGSPAWRLLATDLVEMPVDEDKAARLRELRKKKKENLRRMGILLNTAGFALDKLRGMLKTMEDGEL
jgi:hypothetical protein